MSNRLYNQFFNSPERQPIFLQGSFTQVGNAGARAELTHGDNIFTAVAYGPVGNAIKITLIDPGADQALAIIVTGNSIVVTLAYATGAITTTSDDLVTAIQADMAASALITIAAPNTSLVTALSITPLAGGANTVLASTAMNMSMTQIDVGLFKIQLEDDFPVLLSAQISYQSATAANLIPQLQSADTAFGTSKSIIFRMITMDAFDLTDMASGDVLYVSLILRNSSN